MGTIFSCAKPEKEVGWMRDLLQRLLLAILYHGGFVGEEWPVDQDHNPRNRSKPCGFFVAAGFVAVEQPIL